jgi:hypothetical protein
MLHYKVRYYYYLRFSIVVHVSSFLISEINIGLHYSTVYFFSYIKENARMLMGQPPRPPGPTPAQRARIRAIQVDRFSRFFFPFLFTVLNGSYWVVFASYL